MAGTMRPERADQDGGTRMDDPVFDLETPREPTPGARHLIKEGPHSTIWRRCRGNVVGDMVHHEEKTVKHTAPRLQD